MSGGLKTRSVPALERAFSALELLAASKSGLSLPELSRRLDLPKSSTHAILLTMERRGYLHRNPRTNRYLFGLGLFSLANMALAGLELREKAAPFLRALVLRTRMTAHLAMLDQREAVLIEKLEPAGVQKVATWLGKRMDLHCTAVGKAIIACLDEQQVDELIQTRGLPRHNDNTISSARRLKKDLEMVRARGYAIDDEEDEVGYRCIGAPIFDQGGRVIAAVSVSAETAVLEAEVLQKLAKQVQECAGLISASLGQEVLE